MGEDPARKAEDRMRYDLDRACTATLAVAVGSHLADVHGTGLHSRGIEVHNFEPGLLDVPLANGLPPTIDVLVLGRADDYQLKGLDIAARAFSRLDRNKFTSSPRFVVRGASAGTTVEFRKRLKASAGRPLRPIVREYTTDASLISTDFLSSSVVLMPSRGEGFGLVGLEAISAGVPVLISGCSGLAELLNRHAPKFARFCVVNVEDDEAVDTAAWQTALQAVLVDRKAAFSRAKKLRKILNDKLSWEKSVKAMVERLYATPAAVD